MKALFFILFTLISLGLLGQESTPYRPKLAEFSWEQITDSRVSSRSIAHGDANSVVDNDILWKFKLGAPLIMKKNHKLGVQFKYYQQRFRFDPDDLPDNYELFDHLNGRKITNTGVRLFYQQSLSETSELTFLAGAEHRGDKVTLTEHSSQYYFSGVYTVQKNENTKLGGGFYVGRQLGVFTISPVLIYERKLSPKWVLDLKLPKEASIRHKLNAKSFLIAKAEGRGSRYNLTNAIAGGSPNLTLRKLDLQLTLNYEREIHDWLWVGLSAGYSKNFRYYIANPGDRGRDALFNLTAQSAPFTKVSIFLVPPKRFYQ